MFQFLIGSLETLKNPKDIETLSKFQFLIGSLETMTIIPMTWKLMYVSIPHR